MPRKPAAVRPSLEVAAVVVTGVLHLVLVEAFNYTEPLNGSYQNCRLVSRGETLTTKMLANLTLNVDDILG